MEKAKGPQFLRFCIPIVETLQELGGSGQPKEVTDTVLERLHISEREQAQTNKNGGSRVRNQVAWARFYLAKADVLDASRRGVWALTEKGRTVHLSPNAKGVGSQRSAKEWGQVLQSNIPRCVIARPDSHWARGGDWGVIRGDTSGSVLGFAQG
jgi:hypothetical protein